MNETVPKIHWIFHLNVRHIVIFSIFLLLLVLLLRNPKLSWSPMLWTCAHTFCWYLVPSLTSSVLPCIGIESLKSVFPKYACPQRSVLDSIKRKDFCQPQKAEENQMHCLPSISREAQELQKRADVSFYDSSCAFPCHLWILVLQETEIINGVFMSSSRFFVLFSFLLFPEVL